MNLTAACARCNSAKNDRHLLQHLLDTRESRGERMRQLATFTPEWSHGGVLVLAAALAAASPCQDVPLPEGLLA